MHDTACELGRVFFDTYLPTVEALVLDVGSLDVNGSLRSVAPSTVDYVGVDMVAGPGVDVVLGDPHVLPFSDQKFDAVVATSCFEHDTMFWVTFLEMVRVTRPGGYIYVNSPSNGWFHQHPRDNWRFYPDAGVSLQEWALREGYDVALVESFIARRKRNIWNDCVMVFERSAKPTSRARISDRVDDIMNLRRGNSGTSVEKYCQATEDQLIIQHLISQIGARESHITELRAIIDACQQVIEVLTIRDDDESAAPLTSDALAVR